jgi:hypothetical protein
VMRRLEPISEIIPQRDAEFAAGVHQTEEGVSAVASGVAVLLVCAAADLA